jgi:hypothetical protein
MTTVNNIFRRRTLCIVFLINVVFCLFPLSTYAQKVSIGTNFIDYVLLGTINTDFQYSISRHLSLESQVKYNPFIYNSNNINSRIQNRQKSIEVGIRYWPWVSYSGWWIRAGAQYS